MGVRVVQTGIVQPLVSVTVRQTTAPVIGKAGTNAPRLITAVDLMSGQAVAQRRGECDGLSFLRVTQATFPLHHRDRWRRQFTAGVRVAVAWILREIAHRGIGGMRHAETEECCAHNHCVYG